MKLSPLAFPKGVKLLCELCHETAYIQCTACNVTYYCSQDHQITDWEAIHQKICPNLEKLRKPLPPILYKEERLKRDASILKEKLELVEFCHKTTLRYLFEDQKDLAMPTALQCLNFAMMVHGSDSLEIVPCFILLAEACISMNKLPQAAEYLAQASWHLLRAHNSDTPPSLAIISRLHRTQGRLHSAQGENNDALREFSQDVYHSSMEYGTDDIRTSGGYYFMAEVFFQQGKRQIADSMYKQVIQTWYGHLHRIFKYQTRLPPKRRGVGPGIMEDDVPVVPDLDDAYKPEALKVLTSIYKVKKKQRKCPPRELLMVILSLAMLHFVLHHTDQAKRLGKKAVAVGQTIPDDPHSHDAIDFFTKCDTQM